MAVPGSELCDQGPIRASRPTTRSTPGAAHAARRRRRSRLAEAVLGADPRARWSMASADRALGQGRTRGEPVPGRRWRSTAQQQESARRAGLVDGADEGGAPGQVERGPAGNGGVRRRRPQAAAEEGAGVRAPGAVDGDPVVAPPPGASETDLVAGHRRPLVARARGRVGRDDVDIIALLLDGADEVLLPGPVVLVDDPDTIKPPPVTVSLTSFSSTIWAISKLKDLQVADAGLRLACSSLAAWCRRSPT